MENKKIIIDGVLHMEIFDVIQKKRTPDIKSFYEDNPELELKSLDQHLVLAEYASLRL